MNPIGLNRFMRKLVREPVVPTISARVCRLTLQPPGLHPGLRLAFFVPSALAATESALIAFRWDGRSDQPSLPRSGECGKADQSHQLSEPRLLLHHSCWYSHPRASLTRATVDS